MDARMITPAYSVSPQILPEDMADIAARGFVTVICNRPDAEVPPDIHADVMAQAAAQAGLAFHALPLTHQTMTPENIARQRALIEGSQGPVLAYCASGTRSSVIWALGEAGHSPVDQVLAATRAAGYALDNLRPTLELAAQQAR